MTCPSDLPLRCQLLVFVLAARSKSSCSTLIRKSRNCGQEQPPYVDHLFWKLQFVKIFLLSRAATICRSSSSTYLLFFKSSQKARSKRSCKTLIRKPPSGETGGKSSHHVKIIFFGNCILSTYFYFSRAATMCRSIIYSSVEKLPPWGCILGMFIPKNSRN